MIRKAFLYLVVFVLLISCSRNEYEIRRFSANRFTIKPNDDARFSEIINTSVFYQSDHSKPNIKKYNLQNHHSGLKFYKDGRVGIFNGVDFDQYSSFNPKKASMGYYNYNDEGLFIEYFYKIPGGTYILSRNTIILNKSSGDTLEVKNFESATSSGKISKYVKRMIPTEALNFKVDW